MVKQDIAKFYQNAIRSSQNEVFELRQQLDEQLDYCGQMQRKLYELTGAGV